MSRACISRPSTGGLSWKGTPRRDVEDQGLLVGDLPALEGEAAELPGVEEGGAGEVEVLSELLACQPPDLPGVLVQVGVHEGDPRLGGL